MVLTSFLVQDNVQVWHKSTIGFLMQVCCILAYCNPRDILLWTRDIQGCLNVMTVSLSRKDKIIQTGWSLHLKMFHLICIVWQIPMVEMFATNMNHKLPFYVASPGCKYSEHRCIKHLVGGSGLLGLLSCTTHSKKSLNKWTPGAKWL